MLLSKYGPLMAVVAIIAMALVTTINQWNQKVRRDQVLQAEIDPGIAAIRAESARSTFQTVSSVRSYPPAPLSAATRKIGPEGESQLAAMRIAELDHKLRAEPFDPAWVRKQEEVISQAIVGSPNDGFDVPLPESLDASCRSTLCRIQMTYADEEDAMQMQTKLTLGLSGSIATARTFYQPNETGGMDLVVFAGAVD
ncbi:MAG: hypothetical protein L0H23_03375 [Luteimonas sp.]|nr:hypothetical protein [Luteimonas sp.]